MVGALWAGSASDADSVECAKALRNLRRAERARSTGASINPFVKGEGMSPKARRELLGHGQLALTL